MAESIMTRGGAPADAIGGEGETVTPLEAIVDPEVRAAVARLREVSPAADPTARLPGVHPAALPAHVAIIMDGNGRWAQAKGFSREFGHRHGAIAVRRVLDETARLGVRQLTLYSFSRENWKRPTREVGELMRLATMYLEGEREALRRNNIRLRHIGDRATLPGDVRRAIDDAERATERCTGVTLCLAMNYGSRGEIVRAARRLAERAAAGELSPDAIDEPAFAGALDTAGMPDPDLLIRTAGEMRVSNFLLWQISYAELVVSERMWPEFDAEAFRLALREYAGRSRRFGGLAGSSGGGG